MTNTQAKKILGVTASELNDEELQSLIKIAEIFKNLFFNHLKNKEVENEKNLFQDISQVNQY